MKKIEKGKVKTFARSMTYEKYNQWSAENHKEELEVLVNDTESVPGEISAKKVDSTTGEIRVTVHIYKPKIFGLFSSKADLFSVFPDGRIEK